VVQENAGMGVCEEKAKVFLLISSYAPKCALKVGVCCVYVLFGKFGILIHCDVCGETVVYDSVGSEPVRGITKYSLRFCHLGPNCGKDRRPNFEDAIHEGNWAVVCRVVWFGFIRLVYEFCGAYAPTATQEPVRTGH